MASSRRLAAIMFTDIVGYTSLMGSDEKRAIDIIRKNRRIHWRSAKKYKGKLLKEMGDGMLLSFSSGMEAVVCALAIQKASMELEIPLRIGIHLGDIIFERKDVLGDGVNIASRIQGVADTNGIVISETVFNNIRNKGDLKIDFLGRRSLKGVQSEIGIYKVSCLDYSKLQLSIDTGELIRPLENIRRTISVGIVLLLVLAFTANFFLSKRSQNSSEFSKSILVLPFDNYTGNDTLEYAVAGMHSSLIGELGRLSGLRVISPHTSQTFKNTDKSLSEIAKELNVDVIVDAAIMCFGDSICFQMKLISVEEEERLLWSLDYTRDKSQVLNLYTQITWEITEEIQLTLSSEEQTLLTLERTIDPVVYELYSKGQFYLDQINDASLKSAMKYFKLAIEIEPNWAPPYTGLAEVGAYQKQGGFVQNDVVSPMIQENLSTALTLDPNSANSHYVKAVISVWTDFDWEEGESEFLKAIELNPSHARSRIFYAHLLTILRRTDEALYQAKIANELDPLNAFTLGLYADVLRRAGECETAKDQAEKGLSIEPNHYFTRGC